MDKLRREIRKIAGKDAPTQICALCGRASRRTRTLCKRGRHLMVGYYRPRLSAEEMFKLPQGESDVCSDRPGCGWRQYKE